MPTKPQTFRSKERARDRERFRGSKQQRGYGGEWELISRMKRAQCPVCEVCCNATADDVDHVIPFDGVSDPKRTEWVNLQSICRDCHNKKTRRQNGR